jgi:hypothetical protein
MFDNVVPRISEMLDATATFLNSIAAKAAKVTSHTALLFKVFLITVIFGFVIVKIVITPASVETAKFTFVTAKTTVAMIGKNEMSNCLSSVLWFVSIIFASVFWF